MEENRNLAEELQKPQVETYDTTELVIIAAIKKGFNTLDAIQEETTIKANYLSNIVKSMVEKDYLIEVPGSECNTYVIKYKENHEEKKLRLPGTLILPVSTFVDSQGQRWVTRGKWHKIDNDIDIVNDIEWYDDTDNNDQMKTVMKMVSNKKRTTSGKEQSARMKDAGEAPEEIEKWTTEWAPISEHLKLKVIKGGSTESMVTISPRLVTESSTEFPWGTVVNEILPNTEILEYIEKKNYNKEYSIDKMIQNFKRIRAFKSVDNNMVVFGDFYYKKTTINMTMFERNMSTGKDKNLSTRTVSDLEEVKKLIETEFPLFTEIINKHNETCNS